MKRVRSVDKTRLPSAQGGAASSSGNGTFPGPAQGNMGGGNFDYPQMQQMFAAMIGMMNAEKDEDTAERRTPRGE